MPGSVTYESSSSELRVRRGDIYYADMGEGVGSEQQGIRPVLVIQNDTGNLYSTTTIVALITSIHKKKYLPIHQEIKSSGSGLPRHSVVMLEQIRTIDKSRLTEKISQLDNSTIIEIGKKLKISLALDPLGE